MTPSLPRSPIYGVAFGLGGLLVNTEELDQDVGGELLRRRGRTSEPDLLARMMGRPQRVSLRIMIDWHGLADTIEVLAREMGESFSGLLDTRLDPMPGAIVLVASLAQRRLPRCVAKSSGPGFAHDVLSGVGLRDWFGFVPTSADVTHGKPHPEIHECAADRLGVASAEMHVLEDSESGCRAAVAAGAAVVAVPGGHSRRHDFPGARFVA
jgi:HAD superfamily hydrolase (TIGR01509 family)